MSAEPDSVAQITRDTDHVAEGLGLLYRQFRGKPLLTALLTAWLAQVQGVEDALWALLACTLETAVGAPLDQLGRVLGFPRGLLGDDSFRGVLRAVVLARRSSGRAEDLIAVMRAAFGSTDFAYAEGSASVLLEPHAPIGFDPAALFAVLTMAKAGGVQLGLINPPDAEAFLFTLSTDPFRSTAGDTSMGLSDVDQLVGGKFTGALG